MRTNCNIRNIEQGRLNLALRTSPTFALLRRSQPLSSASPPRSLSARWDGESTASVLNEALEISEALQRLQAGRFEEISSLTAYPRRQNETLDEDAEGGMRQ
jgi:hypothetical protein